jgi:hypothetical protein
MDAWLFFAAFEPDMIRRDAVEYDISFRDWCIRPLVVLDDNVMQNAREIFITNEHILQDMGKLLKERWNKFKQEIRAQYQLV